MNYSDKYGTFFGRVDIDGYVVVLHAEDGEVATRLDANVYPVESEFSARYEHAAGIRLTVADTEKLGIKIE